MAIWVIKDGQREGPYAEQDVRELVYEGTYTDTDPAIRDGQFDWTTLGQVLRRQPPPPPPEAAPPAAAEPPPATPTLPPEPAEQAAAEPPPVPIPATLIPPELPEPVETPPRPIKVAVIDFEMPFGSMVVLMVKWVLASIPALVILGAVAAIFWTAFFALISAALHH